MKTVKDQFDCIQCGQANLCAGMIEVPGVVRHEKYAVTMPGLVCPQCGYKTIEGPALAEYGRLLADKYREAHHLLTSNEIRARRNRLEMNQDEFARHLGVGIASIKRWEMGKIQDVRSNQLILDRTSQLPARTQTGKQYNWMSCDIDTSTVQSVGYDVVFVCFNTTGAVSEQYQLLDLTQSVADELQWTVCRPCDQTALRSVILDVPDHQTVPAYIASLVDHS